MWIRGTIVVVSSVAVLVTAGPARAYPAPGASGWHDLHHNYPPRPDGYRAILRVFGNPCAPRAYRNAFTWKARDNGVRYKVRFHRRLGGWFKRGTSTNLDNDVRGHIRWGRGHKRRYIRSGIFGYNCRFIAGTTTYSTHAWGIAVDVSTNDEPRGQCYSTVNYHHARIWKRHRWIWGKRWCDPHHFQYATGY